MPNDPLDFTIWGDIADRLGNMRRAEGYHLDYGGVRRGARVVGAIESDYSRPKIGLRWLGDQPIDPLSGGDIPATSQERRPLFEITVPARDPKSGDDDATKRAFRIRADVHLALMGATSTEASNLVRTRGVSNAATFETDIQWRDTDENGEPIGGTLFLTYLVRFRHETGDASSVR